MNLQPQFIGKFYIKKIMSIQSAWTPGARSHGKEQCLSLTSGEGQELTFVKSVIIYVRRKRQIPSHVVLQNNLTSLYIETRSKTISKNYMVIKWCAD